MYVVYQHVTVYWRKWWWKDYGSINIGANTGKIILYTYTYNKYFHSFIYLFNQAGYTIMEEILFYYVQVCYKHLLKLVSLFLSLGWTGLKSIGPIGPWTGVIYSWLFKSTQHAACFKENNWTHTSQGLYQFCVARALLFLSHIFCISFIIEDSCMHLPHTN